MNELELERRLTRLVTRHISQEVATLSGFPEVGCVNTLGELDGFFKSLGKVIKRTIKAPIKMTQGIVKSIVKGDISILKKEVKSQVEGIKQDLRDIGPVAAIVANVIPGVGQLVSAGIAAATAAVKASDAAKAAKAQAEADAIAQRKAEDEARAALAAAQAAADAAALEQAKKTQEIADQVKAEAAASEQRARELRDQAQKIADAAAATKQAEQSGLITMGMTPEMIAAQITRQSLANRGVAMNSPEAQEIVYDYAAGQVQAGAGGGLTWEQIKPGLPWLALAGVGVWWLARDGRSASGSRMRRRDWK